VYGNGAQIRDWLHVEDHCAALRLVLERGAVGRRYNIGGYGETANIDMVRMLCEILDRKHPRQNGEPHHKLIRFVTDRPGHDWRYAIDPSRIRDELGWAPNVSLTQGLADTVDWYVTNSQWLERVRTGEYRSWVRTHYAQ
jgi:dTDP-glucose 4,6-dehydratase